MSDFIVVDGESVPLGSVEPTVGFEGVGLTFHVGEDRVVMGLSFEKLRGLLRDIEQGQTRLLRTLDGGES